MSYPDHSAAAARAVLGRLGVAGAHVRHGVSTACTVHARELRSEQPDGFTAGVSTPRWTVALLLAEVGQPARGDEVIVGSALYTLEHELPESGAYIARWSARRESL